MSRPAGPSTTALALRGVAAVVLLVSASVALVARGGGAFDTAPEVTAQLPAAAGLVVGTATVRYRGVPVGKLAGIDSGTTSSTVTLRMDPAQIDRVPAAVLVRVVPRTLFGGMYLDLVPAPPDPVSPGRAQPVRALRPGDDLAVDTSADAVQLAQLYDQVNTLLTRLEPAKLQVALTAMAEALRGRGAVLGDTISRTAEISTALLPLVESAVASAPEVTRIAEQLGAATPDLLAGLAAATRLSETLLQHAPGVELLLTRAVSLAALAGSVVQENEQRAITVVHAGSRVLSSFARNTGGLASTLDQLDTFGAAGAKVFATGRFNITAVPSFSDPLPYTAADCPRYPGLDGPSCPSAFVPGVSNVVGSPQEQQALSYLQGALQPGAQVPAGAAPSVATTVLLGPLVRGTQVEVP